MDAASNNFYNLLFFPENKIYFLIIQVNVVPVPVNPPMGAVFFSETLVMACRMTQLLVAELTVSYLVNKLRVYFVTRIFLPCIQQAATCPCYATDGYSP
jgi:hypothetical protein